MLEFNEKDHKYTLDGKELISVTQLMQKHGLAPSYAGVSNDVLQAKAERGTLIHEEIELYNKKGQIGFTNEMALFKDYIEMNKVKVMESELRLHNDIVAGTCDLILNYGDGCYTIADIKTTYTLHLDAVSWQLSIYAYLTKNAAITKGQAFHFTKDGELNVVNIPLKPMEEVEKLMECERKGELYKFDVDAAIKDDVVEPVIALEQLIQDLDQQVKAAKQQQEILKEELLKEMEERGLKTFEKNGVKITYVAPQTRTSIDSTRLKKEMPEIAEKYSKESQVKASIKITIKEK